MLPPPSLRRAQTAPDGVPLLQPHHRRHHPVPDAPTSTTMETMSGLTPSSQGMMTKTPVPSLTTNRMYLERQRSKRDLLRTRVLSQRILRTLSEMIIEEDAQEEEQSSNSSSDQTMEVNLNGSTNGVSGSTTAGFVTNATAPPTTAMPDFVRSASTSSYLLKRCLSKRLINTLSECINQDGSGGADTHGLNKAKVNACHGKMKTKDEDEDASSSEGASNYDLDFDDDRSLLLVRSVSTRLIRTISQLFEDDNTEASLDIFADLGSFHTEDSISKSGEAKASNSGNHKTGMSNTEEDGFDNFLMSLKNDDGFHNSLNDWMGSLSDIFDRKKLSAAQGGLTDEDCRAMEINVKRMRDVGQYLRHSLSCRNLMKPRPKEPKLALTGFHRSQSTGTDTPNLPPPPSPSHLRPDPLEDDTDKNNAPAPIRLLSPPKPPSSFVLVGEAERISGNTTMGFQEGQCHNATQPVRLPSPQKSHATLQNHHPRNMAGLPVLPVDL